MARAAAIAFAGEGADVAINYLPAEEPDAREESVFTKGLAKQLVKQGIRVNAVAPGPIWTPLQVTGGQSPQKIPNFGRDTPMGRSGQPAELAAIYVLLASNEDSYSTGQVYGAVGGRGGP
jgi:NAD(P)-dependent dehydrogenase (short-subunit alcohol dehydrogenase family)